MFVSQEVNEIVWPPFPNNWEGKRHSKVRALLDSFTEGDVISVAEDPYDKAASAILARVDAVEAEVWDIRCLDPSPGIRVFGRFSEPDTFIALTWEYRENVDWPTETARCQAAWRALFGAIAPHSGSALHEYISYNFYSV